MTEQRQNSDPNYTLDLWLFEGLWWVISAIIALLVLLPVWRYHLQYPILFENILGIIVAIHITRFLFLHRFIPYMQGVRSKTAVLLTGIVLLIIMLRYFSGITTFVKDVGFFEIFSHIESGQILGLAKYMKTQLIFAYTAALTGLVVLPVVLLRSIWKQYNNR